MWFDCGMYFVHIHLGIAGWINFKDIGYTKYILVFKDNIKIFLDDMRKFSKISIFKINKHNEKINKLGPDIFSQDYSLEFFKNNIQSIDKMIVYFLLEQKYNAGIGNLIKNESLYISKINPKIKTKNLDLKKIKNLYEAIKFVCFSNLIEMLKKANIKIPFDIQKNKPLKLQIPYKIRVYDKLRDSYGNKITLEIIGGRKTYYVKSRQKL